MVDQQLVAGLRLDGASNALAVLGTKKQGTQDQKVQRPLQKSNTVFLISGCHSTQVCSGLGRMSTRKKQSALSVQHSVPRNSPVDHERKPLKHGGMEAAEEPEFLI